MEKLKDSEFKLKDIVWAKAKGNPWWPGIIKKISFYNIPKSNQIVKEKIFTIDFIGEKSHVKLTKDNIELFLDNYKKHFSAKQPSLIRSIKLAKKMCDKKISRKIINLEENISENIYDIKEQNNKEKESINNINNKKKGKKKEKIYQEAIESEYDSDDEMSYEDYKNIETKSKNINEKKNFSQKDEQQQHINKKIINEKNEKDDNNIKINININLTNNNNTFNLFGLQNIGNLANNIDINKNNNEKVNLINNTINKINEEKDIKNDDTFPSLLMPKIFNLDAKKQFEEQNNDIAYKDNNNEKEIICTNEIICELTQKLVNYQLNLSNTINHQTILDELENFHNILKNSLIKEQNYKDIDFMNKDLLSVLLAFKLNKNNEIKQKATNIFTILTEFIIKDIFIFNEDETNNLKGEISKIHNNSNSNNFFDNEYNFGLKLCELINQNSSSNISLLNKKNKRNNINNLIISDNNESSSDSDILDDNNINYEINEELYKIIFNLKTDKSINEFNNLSENFYKNEYNKNNNGLDLINSIKRKKICIKMFNLFRKILPKEDDILLKKLIIYYEYRIRNEDKTLGKKYYKIINNLFNKIKTLL